MKKMIMFFALVIVFVCAATAEQIQTTFTTGVAQVINTGKTQIFSVIPVGGDAAADTKNARTIMFYDNISVRVSTDPHDDLQSFSWVLAPGQYSTDVPALSPGHIYTKWGYDVTEGISFSEGLVVSPTAGEKYIIQWIDK